MGMRVGRFVRDSAAVFATKVSLIVLGTCTGVITARILGPHDRGIFSLLSHLPGTAANFVKLGIPQANVYYVRRHGRPVSAVAANSLRLAVVLGVGLTVICLLGRDVLLRPILRGVETPYLIPILFLFPFVLAESYFLGIVQALERFRLYNLQQLARAGLIFAGMAVALLWLRAGLGGAIAVQVVGVGAVAMWLVWRVHREAPVTRPWDGELGRQTLRFGSKSYVQTLASHLHFRVGMYMCAYFLDPAQVAFYAIAVGMTNLILNIPDALGTVIFPQLAAVGERDAHARTSALCRHTVLVTLCAAAVYAVAGNWIIGGLYGSRYLPAVAPMRLMLPGVVMISLYLILSRNFTSRNRQEVNIVAAGAALAINFGLNVYLIPRLGVSGAAISASFSYSVAALVLLFWYAHESGRGVADTLLVRGRDVALYGRLLAGWRARAGAGAGEEAGWEPRPRAPVPRRVAEK